MLGACELEDLEIKPHLITSLKGRNVSITISTCPIYTTSLLEEAHIIGTDAESALDLVMNRNMR